ncbi:MAG: L-arabinose isomerase [Propionibacteriaceae bacterium]|jgi:L-arabinose isomerase|nr:L-arabinose isomerase [Propionibacteriaceae bacterium]
MTALTQPGAVWFLTGSQGLYGEDTLAQVADQSKRVAEGLAGAGLPVDVVWKPVLTSKDAIRRIMLEANADDACVGVICWMHTFSPAKMWIAGLDALDKPLCHLHTQADAELPWSTIDMDFMNLNQAAHGDREFAYIETRLGVARSTVVGHVSDPATIAGVDTWARAALGRAAVRAMRLVRFGDNMRDVAVTEGDKVEAEHVFGVNVTYYGVNDLVDAVAAVSDSEAETLAADYEGLYDVVADLRQGGERHDSLVYSAKLEIALRSFLTEVNATAFTTNFEDLGALKQLPGMSVQRLMADGYGFGAEGDWKTAMLVRTANAMGQGRTGGASLMEDYTYNLTPGHERILGAHMLEVSPTLTAQKVSCEIHPLGIGDREDPVRLVFTADPGPAIVVGLADLRDRFRLTANTVQIVEPDEPMPKLPVGRAVWSPDPDFQTSTRCWLTAGAPHHTVMSTATDAEIWKAFATMVETELALITTGTNVDEFSKELRWNAAYHRLARGL